MRRKVGFFTQWSSYERGFFVKDIDTSGMAAQLTHLGYAFGNVGADGRCFQANQPGEGDAWADYQRRLTAEQSVTGEADRYDQPLAGNLNQLRQLKAKHPHLKLFLALGGWNWSKHFHAAAATPQSRAAHVESCIDLWIRGNLPGISGEPQGGEGVAAGIFDGIELDWEWPGSPGGPGNIADQADKWNFTALLAEYRAQLDAVGQERGTTFELTAFLPFAPAAIQAGYQVPEIFDLLTSATVQGYDIHTGYEPITDHQSALYSPTGDPVPGRFCVDSGVTAWRDAGAPATKLVVGVPLHGCGWTGVSGGGDGLFQPATGPAPGTFEAGHEPYRVLRQKARPEIVHRDEEAGFAWLYDGRTFWTYDDPIEMARKAAYIDRNGLGGAMAWSLDADTADAELVTALMSTLDGRGC